MNNLYIGLLRLENRAAFFVQAKASQVTPRETAEEQLHTLARGWLAYPVTPRTHIYRRRAVSYVSTGLACLPRDANTRTSTAEERLYMPTHGRFANPLTPSQPQSPCKLFIQPLFGGRFFILQLTPGRQANLGLRLYNRPSAVAEASTEAHFVAELFRLQTDR